MCNFKNAFNIENAVDQKGNSVNLPGIDFIKIVAGGFVFNEGTLPGIAVRNIYTIQSIPIVKTIYTKKDTPVLFLQKTHYYMEDN